jgi:hypothetical protein
VAAEEEIESFISYISSGEVSSEKLIDLVIKYMGFQNQNLFPPQLPDYIRQKLKEKQRIDEHIQQVDAVLQSKNVTIEAINEYLKLSEELDKHGISTQDIGKLLNILLNAGEYQFDPKKNCWKVARYTAARKERKAA